MMPGPRASAVAAVALVAGAFGAVPLLRPADAAVAAWSREWAKGPTLAALDYALRFGLLGLVVAAAWTVRAPVRALGGALLLIASGNFAAEVLKTAIERARPSDALLAGGGNSLPSGHVMGCTVTALAAVGLMRRGAWSPATRRALAAAASLAVVLESLLRLLRGSHWLSDVAVSILLGAAWVLAACAIVPAGRRAVASALAGLVAVYLLFYWCPGLRLQVP